MNERLRRPTTYWVYDPVSGLLLPGLTANAQGLSFIGGVFVGIGNSVVSGGAFTDVATGPTAQHIIIKTGLAAALPALLLPGEFGFATDTRQLWIGGGDKNEPVPIGNKGFVTVTPAALTADQNNYTAPVSGVPTITTDNLYLRLSTDGIANRTVTGLAIGQAAGQLLIVRNVDGAKTITLTNASGSSAAANRFDSGNPATDITLLTNQIASFVYDSIEPGWAKF